MATAVLTNIPTVIDNAEAITNWGGDTFSLDPDVKIQGNNSVSCVQSASGANDAYVTGTWDFSGTGLGDQHVRLWINTTNIVYMETLANDGVQIFLYDGTNTAYWTVGGSDTYAGGWKQFVVYTGNTPTSGTVTKSSITRIGIRINAHTKPRNVVNWWADAWTFGDGYTVTGGTSGDEIDWTHVAALDKIAAYGIVEELNGVLFLAGEITIGAGATTTFFKEDGQIVVFRDLPVNSTLYKLIFEGSACNIDLNGGVWAIDGSLTYGIDVSDTNLNSFDIDGKQISGAGATTLSAGPSVTNCGFSGCGQIDPSSANFDDNVIKATTDVDAALLWNESISIQGCSFALNTIGAAIEHPSAVGTPYAYNGLVFLDNTYDVLNSSGSAITINLSNGADASTSEGSAVTFINSKTFKFTVSPSITNYEWRIYTVTALGSMAGASEIDGEESATVDNQTYAYNYSSDQAIAVQIIPQPDEDYVESITYYTLKNSDQDLTILLIKDINN